MSHEAMEARMIEDSCSTYVEQKAEKDEIAGELFVEINDIITLLIASLNTSK
ncbi:MAG: hypothetical protein NTX75_04335 [Proteobacteria bacterium]|jgi:hypothetical protein|nr:hypothetical protein [Pseudomonadota bacterium]